MDRNAVPDLPERRTFLKTAGGALAASLSAPALVAASSASASAEAPQEAPVPASVQRKIPIGVFDPTQKIFRSFRPKANPETRGRKRQSESCALWMQALELLAELPR